MRNARRAIAAAALLVSGCFGSLALAQEIDVAQPSEELQPADPMELAAPFADLGLTPEATVTRVIDGSTLDARINGQRVAIGYLGVQTVPANQPCGQLALQRNRELAGDYVLLMSDPLYDFDELGRRLFYAFTMDGISIDETLVREGLAHAVRTDGVEGSTLAAAEAEAAAAGRGCIWGEGFPST